MDIGGVKKGVQAPRAATWDVLPRHHLAAHGGTLVASHVLDLGLVDINLHGSVAGLRTAQHNRPIDWKKTALKVSAWCVLGTAVAYLPIGTADKLGIFSGAGVVLFAVDPRLLAAFGLAGLIVAPFENLYKDQLLNSNLMVFVFYCLIFSLVNVSVLVVKEKLARRRLK